MARPLLTVEAAGGVVWRDRRQQREVLVVHRPGLGDWSFPKGKWQQGDLTLVDTARREIYEETGWSVVIGEELLGIEYIDRKGRQRHTRYWEMLGLAGKFRPSREIDATRWVPADRVHQVLTYERDRQVLAAFRRWSSTEVPLSWTLERFA